MLAVSYGTPRAPAPAPALLEAADALRRNDLERAERLIRARLAEAPGDVEALRLLAGVAAAAGFLTDAERLLRDAIARSPAFVLAYSDLAELLCRLERAEEAVALLDQVVAARPQSAWALSLKASVLTGEGRIEDAIEVHEQLVACAPRASVPWTNYAHALTAVGRAQEAVGAYRRSLELDPANGFAWWGLANLRTVRLGADDVARMQRALPGAGEGLSRIQLHFALGKALGDCGLFEASFHQYAQANRLRGALTPYDPEALTRLVDRIAAAFKAEAPDGRGAPAAEEPTPIFIVGMPRSGSSLVEQILSSHPLVEGMGELADLQTVVASLGEGDAWPESAAGLSPDRLRALGRRYLDLTRRRRRTDRPFFTDKMPSNWRYVGLIRRILPHAKIVDVRRSALACCFSNFSTYFARQTSAPTDLVDLGRCYRDYTRAIAHFDAIMPGRVHRLRHEELVEDLEGGTRRLLACLDLPFDGACLRFERNPRAVHTPSAEQVRRPINKDGLDRWRDYEPWLEPLKSGLGPELAAD